MSRSLWRDATLGAVATLIAFSLTSTPAHALAKPVVPDFAVSTVTKLTKKDKKSAVRIYAIRITAPDIANLKLKVSCRNSKAGCWRFKKTKVRISRSGDTITWNNVNWLIRKKSNFIVTAKRKGYLGRRKVIGPRRTDPRELVFKSTSCIDRKGDITRCPGASVDAPNDTVPQENPASPTTPSSPSSPPAPPSRVITVDNRVTNGMGMREDPTPVRLTTQAWIYCGTRGCNINGTERTSGGTYDAAICQTTGERTTNGHDTDASDDANPERFESTRYYGVRLSNGTFGYVSEVWIRASDRGGLGLPGC